MCREGFVVSGLFGLVWCVVWLVVVLGWVVVIVFVVLLVGLWLVCLCILWKIVCGVVSGLGFGVSWVVVIVWVGVVRLVVWYLVVVWGDVVLCLVFGGCFVLFFELLVDFFFDFVEVSGGGVSGDYEC